MNKTIQNSDINNIIIIALYKIIYNIFSFTMPYRGINMEDIKKIINIEGYPKTGLIYQININLGILSQQLEDFKDNLGD